MTRIPLLVDTDPGVDDALALLMAFDDPRHEVVGLTIAAGNVGLAHTVRNALKLCEVAQHPVPVFAGTQAPLLHPARDAGYVHGLDGFGDIAYDAPVRAAEAEPAPVACARR
jgi:purine nucleosidase